MLISLIAYVSILRGLNCDIGTYLGANYMWMWCAISKIFSRSNNIPIKTNAVLDTKMDLVEGRCTDKDLQDNYDTRQVSQTLLP